MARSTMPIWLLFCMDLLNFAIYRLIPITLTLPGVAGFILSIGMAVDSNILIFERFKEEKRLGKTVESCHGAGIRESMGQHTGCKFYDTYYLCGTV